MKVIRTKKGLDPLLIQLFPEVISKGNIKKAEIVQAIVDIVANEGFEALSFERIGKAVKISKSHVVYHFHSKNEMLIKGFEYVISLGQSLIVDRITKSTPGLPRLEAYFEAHLDWAKSHPSQTRFLVMFYGRSCYDTELRLYNQAVRLAGKKRIIEMLKEDPKIKTSTAELASGPLQDMINGALTDLLSYYKNPSESERKEKLNSLLRITRVLWNGLKK